MIFFSPLRTRRLTVQLKELSIGDSLALAAMPGHTEEANITAFLRLAIDQSKEAVEDPISWTVSERILAVCHYLCATSDDGPDFSVGNGHYSDYIDDSDVDSMVQTIEIGEVGNDIWHIRHLTGAMAESIETMMGQINGLSGRVHWLFGAMAAQLIRPNDVVPDAATSQGAFDEFILSRVKIFQKYPDSDFIKLFTLYLDGCKKLRYLFNLEFSDNGIIVMPKGGAASNLPPARFSSDPCICEYSRD